MECDQTKGHMIMGIYRNDRERCVKVCQTDLRTAALLFFVFQIDITKITWLIGFS